MPIGLIQLTKIAFLCSFPIPSGSRIVNRVFNFFGSNSSWRFAGLLVEYRCCKWAFATSSVPCFSPLFNNRNPVQPNRDRWRYQFKLQLYLFHSKIDKFIFPKPISTSPKPRSTTRLLRHERRNPTLLHFAEQFSDVIASTLFITCFFKCISPCRQIIPTRTTRCFRVWSNNFDISAN